MKINDWLLKATKKLEDTGIGTARLDCLVLLEDVTGKDRAWVLAHPEFILSVNQISRLDKLIKPRQKHIPLAQVRGKTEFYGREFTINKDVLEPRPESETMIEVLKSLKLLKNSLVADIGTGTGALAITAKLEKPSFEVIATEIDPKCIKIAKQNAKKHHTDIRVLKGNLLEPLSPLTSRLSALLCNLPYVPDSYKINQAAANEPKIAIFGGHDGLELYRQLFTQIDSLIEKPQFILTESLPFQHSDLKNIAKKHSYSQLKEDDFIQLFELT
jgi:release factor glutamine methyltransferase